MHWGSIRLASCSCRIVSISFVLLRFTGIGAILDQRIPSAASHKFMFVLCVDTHLDSSRLTSCCCGVARIHASIAFLHTLKDYPANELHLWDRPNSFLLSYFTRIRVLSDLRLVLWDRPNSNLLLCFTRIWAGSG